MSLRSEKVLADFVEANPKGVAFLRFLRGGLKQGKYSDWDIAVKDCKVAKESCQRLFGEPWLRVPRQYVVQHYYDWGQCDLLPIFEWNGFEYLDQELFWSKVEVGEDGVPRPALGHDAFIVWMTGLLWGRRCDKRYLGFIQLAAREDELNFRECLERIFGSRLSGKLYRIAERGDAAVATHWVSRMRQVLAFRCLRSRPFSAVNRVRGHWWCELGFHRRVAFPWVGILGPDGSGKSTVIEHLAQNLRRSRLKLIPVHWLPSLGPERPREGVPVTDPHAQLPKSYFLSCLQLGKIFIYWWWASFRYLIHLRAKREMVLSDRFYLDLLADPKRYRYGASPRVAKLVFRFLPKPDRIILLHTDADTILARKEEVSKVELERQLRSYRDLAVEYGPQASLVDGGRPVEEVAAEVLDHILEEFKKRSR